MIIIRIYEHQNLLSLWLVSFLVGLRTYQHPCTVVTIQTTKSSALWSDTNVPNRLAASILRVEDIRVRCSSTWW